MITSPSIVADSCVCSFHGQGPWQLLQERTSNKFREGSSCMLSLNITWAVIYRFLNSASWHLGKVQIPEVSFMAFMASVPDS